MSGLLLALSLVTAPILAECDALERDRKAAYDIGKYERALRLVDEEVECIVRWHQLHPSPIEPGSLRSLCLTIDAGFDVANRHRPERALSYLRHYEERGCLADPLQRPRHRTSWAHYQRRQLDDPRALGYLRWGEAEAVIAWFRHWNAPDRWSLLWSIANSMALRAEIAAELRRPDELRELVASASKLLDSVDLDSVDPVLSGSAIADVYNLLGWSMLMAHDAGVDTDDPTDLLKAALDTFVDERPNANKACNTLINLALAASQHRSPREAQAWIEEIERSERCIDKFSDEELMWLRIVQIRRTIADGDPWSSAQWQDELEKLGEEGEDTLVRWYAQATAGRRHEAMGSADAALLAYEQAEVELESYASSRRGVSEAVLAGRRHLTFSRSTRRLVVLLSDLGDDEKALRVVREARSRALRIADMSRSGARLPNTERPRGDELRLVFFQTSEDAEDGSSDWAGFALTAEGPHSESVKLPPVGSDLLHASKEDLEPFAAALLEPFSDELEAAGSVEILATGPLHHVPFHVLPWRGHPLIKHVPVTYSLDLAPASAEEEGSGSGVALVLHGHEAGLQAEAIAVSVVRALRGAASVRSSPDSAEALKEQLSEASIAHFAVHGTRTVDHKLLRTDDRLHFGGGLELSRDEILKGGAAPRLVYLSACQSSFADAETLSGGVGLTQAFLLRGAHHVIGAVDDIDEEVAQAFAVAFYSALGDAPGDVARAWQHAYLEVRGKIDWSYIPHLKMLRLYSR